MGSVERVGIGGPGRVGANRRVAARTGAGGFSIASSEPEEQRVTGAAIPALTLEGVLALQGGLPEDERDREASRRGQALLTALSTLQRSLLAGRDASGLRARLETLAGDMPAAGDPRLAAILGAIRLRTRVELARLTP
jgi:hypothetical protein